MEKNGKNKLRKFNAQKKSDEMCTRNLFMRVKCRAGRERNNEARRMTDAGEGDEHVVDG